jgi:phosphate uptake regulator
MLDWFSREQTSGSAGLQRMRTEFGQMLDAGRHIFDAAANAFLGGTDVEVIRNDLFDTDKRINRAEQKIRREIVVHASVHGAAEFAPCLVLMSVVKDAERVGDYAKNIFDLAVLAPHTPSGEHKEKLVALKDRISRLMAAGREVFDSQDSERAAELIRESQRIEDVCDEQVRSLIAGDPQVSMSSAYVLAYRYFKRVASHVRNVTTSVVQPLDKLDFPAKPPGEKQTESPTEKPK